MLKAELVTVAIGEISQVVGRHKLFAERRLWPGRGSCQVNVVLSVDTERANLLTPASRLASRIGPDGGNTEKYTVLDAFCYGSTWREQ